MGPNSLKMLEELTCGMDLHPGMRVLDLGCGKGMTSIFLANKFGVNVYVTDLWISAKRTTSASKCWVRMIRLYQ